MEWGRVAIANAPGALTAMKGIDQIDDEVKDLDKEEAKVVAESGLKLGLAVMALMGLKES